MARVTALRLRRGDCVMTRGRWEEVKVVRATRRSSGGSMVVTLIFKSGLSIRVNGADVLIVGRSCRAGRTRRRGDRW